MSRAFHMATPARPDQFLRAADVIQTDSVARRVFQLLERQQSSSGWNIARTVDVDPATVEGTLKRLAEVGVVNSEGTGLDAFYYLTSMGFKIREFFLNQ